MHKYKITLENGSVMKFVSELYLPEMPTRAINGNKLVFFEDAGIGFSPNGIMGIEIDGHTYTTSEYLS